MRVDCWGRGDAAPLVSPPWSFQAVSVGAGYACGVHRRGAITCWGRDRPSHRQSRLDAPDGRYQQVGAGAAHACAVTQVTGQEAGPVVCWGDWNYGAQNPPDGLFRSVHIGDFHTCGLTESREVRCWGLDESSRLDAPSGRHASLSVGASHTCAVRESGEIACWGKDEFGNTDAPQGRFRSVAAGFLHSCGIRDSGRIVCWGNNAWGQLNAPDGRFLAVAGGYAHSCAISETNEIACWGDRNPAAVVPQHFAAEWLTVGRIIVRRLANGAVEFGFRLPGGERILPDRRFVSANAPSGRWLDSSPVLVDGQALGRISARKAPSGRIEFSFLTAAGERILPWWRSLAARTRPDIWLWGSEIGIEPPRLRD